MTASVFVQTAITAARAAEKIIRHYYQSGLRFKPKRIDRLRGPNIESEEIIRDTLARAFPDHGFYGEELG